MLRSVDNCITSQKNEDLIQTSAEAWNYITKDPYNQRGNLGKFNDVLCSSSYIVSSDLMLVYSWLEIRLTEAAEG
jgi:hypothetical protein